MAVVVVVVVVVAAIKEIGNEDRRSALTEDEGKMAAMNKKRGAWKHQTVGLGLLMLTLSACAQTSEPPAPTPASPSAAVFSSPRRSAELFKTPDEAVAALIGAERQNDTKALIKILGPHGKKIISSGDVVADKAARARFVAAYDASHKLENDGDNRMTLVVGEEEWPLPIPLTRVGQGEWQFDTAVGEQEILNRRIGRNELNVINICRAYVEAQSDYAAQHRLSDGQIEYAQRFISHRGQHDGLYWPAKAGEEESPFGPLLAHAQAEGYKKGKHHKPQPYHGYFYRILKEQGPHAAGSARAYIVDGHMTKGFALLVYPAKYGDSGVMTFIVNQSGIVFEKNLGAETATAATQITSYDPDDSWHIAKD